MRTLRLSVAGTVALLLLGLGGVSLAQDEQDAVGPAEAQAFTAHMSQAAVIEPDTLEFEGEYVGYRDGVERWVIDETSDPRFSGDVTVLSSIRNYQGPPEVWPARRTARIDGGDGVWQGHPTSEHWFGYRNLPFTMVFTGEGAHEGWTILALATPKSRSQIGLEGHIVEGQLPNAPESPAE